MMIGAIFASTLAMLATSASGAPNHTGSQLGRDKLLVTPAPYPPQRTDSPSRRQNGRLWISRYPVGSRTPIAEQILGDPGSGAYGAGYAHARALIFVRNNHVPVAISPWERFDENGFEHFERARNVWLREQGYVLKVRTHVNARRFYERDRYASSMTPTPRATIHLNDEPLRRSSKMRVLAPIHSTPATRIFKPNSAPWQGAIHVVAPAPATDRALAAADQKPANETGD